MELHITTKCGENVNDFVNICIGFKKMFIKKFNHYEGELYSCKPIIIELSRGININQPMCSINFSYNTILKDLLILEFVNQLKAANMPVKRIKVEEKMYKNKELKTVIDENNYFEYHGLVEWSNLDFANFNIANSHISKSNLSNKPQNFRIVTCRVYALKTKEAFFDYIQNVFKPKLFALNNFVKLVKEEYEYAIQDDNVNIDSGWLTAM